MASSRRFKGNIVVAQLPHGTDTNNLAAVAAVIKATNNNQDLGQEDIAIIVNKNGANVRGIFVANQQASARPTLPLNRTNRVSMMSLLKDEDEATLVDITNNVNSIPPKLQKKKGVVKVADLLVKADAGNNLSQEDVTEFQSAVAMVVAMPTRRVAPSRTRTRSASLSNLSLFEPRHLKTNADTFDTGATTPHRGSPPSSPRPSPAAPEPFASPSATSATTLLRRVFGDGAVEALEGFADAVFRKNENIRVNKELARLDKSPKKWSEIFWHPYNSMNEYRATDRLRRFWAKETPCPMLVVQQYQQLEHDMLEFASAYEKGPHQNPENLIALAKAIDTSYNMLMQRCQEPSFRQRWSKSQWQCIWHYLKEIGYVIGPVIAGAYLGAKHGVLVGGVAGTAAGAAVGGVLGGLAGAVGAALFHFGIWKKVQSNSQDIRDNVENLDSFFGSVRKTAQNKTKELYPDADFSSPRPRGSSQQSDST